MPRDKNYTFSFFLSAIIIAAVREVIRANIYPLISFASSVFGTDNAILVFGVNVAFCGVDFVVSTFGLSMIGSSSFSPFLDCPLSTVTAFPGLTVEFPPDELPPLLPFDDVAIDGVAVGLITKSWYLSPGRFI